MPLTVLDHLKMQMWSRYPTGIAYPRDYVAGLYFGTRRHQQGTAMAVQCDKAVAMVDGNMVAISGAAGLCI